MIIQRESNFWESIMKRQGRLQISTLGQISSTLFRFQEWCKNTCRFWPDIELWKNAKLLKLNWTCAVTSNLSTFKELISESRFRLAFLDPIHRNNSTVLWPWELVNVSVVSVGRIYEVLIVHITYEAYTPHLHLESMHISNSWYLM